jgi:hypothetical protein
MLTLVALLLGPQLLALRVRWEGTTTQQLASTGQGVAALAVAVPLLLLTGNETPRTIMGLAASLKSQAKAAAVDKAVLRKRRSLTMLLKMSEQLLSTIRRQGAKQEAEQAEDLEGNNRLVPGTSCQVQAGRVM